MQNNNNFYWTYNPLHSLMYLYVLSTSTGPISQVFTCIRPKSVHVTSGVFTARAETSVVPFFGSNNKRLFWTSDEGWHDAHLTNEGKCIKMKR